MNYTPRRDSAANDFFAWDISLSNSPTSEEVGNFLILE